MLKLEPSEAEECREWRVELEIEAEPVGVPGSLFDCIGPSERLEGTDRFEDPGVDGADWLKLLFVDIH